jgi:hypothetical protein
MASDALLTTFHPLLENVNGVTATHCRQSANFSNALYKHYYYYYYYYLSIVMLVLTTTVLKDTY